jgi:hypothetical protein
MINRVSRYVHFLVGLFYGWIYGFSFGLIDGAIAVVLFATLGFFIEGIFSIKSRRLNNE